MSKGAPSTIAARIVRGWQEYRGGFWFLPSLSIVLAIAAGLVVPVLDWEVDPWVERYASWATTSAETARSVLGVLASAMVTVAGIVFSITIVALSIAAQYYGSRVIRLFLTDRVSQAAVSVLIGVAIYCLMALRTVRANGAEGPHLSVLVALASSIAALTVLIVFLHHTARILQSEHLVRILDRDLERSLQQIFPEQIGQAKERGREALLLARERGFGTVRSDEEGYLQSIDQSAILHLAVRADRVIELICRPGDFLTRGSPCARVFPPPEQPEAFARKLNGVIILGRRCTPGQDLSCATGELVQVASRALSPGINDPFTANACVDRLMATLARLVERPMPSGYRADDKGHLRIVARPFDFAFLLEATCDPIRQYGGHWPLVVLHLLDRLEDVALRAQRLEHRRAIREQVGVLRRCGNKWPEPADRRRLQVRCARVLEALGAPSSSAKGEAERKERLAERAAARTERGGLDSAPEPSGA